MLADPKLVTLLADDNCVAMLSPMPQAPGHIIIVPRVHITDVFSIDKPAWHALADMACDVAQLVNSELGVTSVNIMHGSGPLANEHSPHMTLHVIPRTEKSEADAKVNKSSSNSKQNNHAEHTLKTHKNS